MKALLLNDFYVFKKDYKTYIGIYSFLILFFVVMSVNMTAESFFDFSYLITPFIVFAMSVITAIFQYDEKSGFMQYAMTMPFTKKEYIKEKYAFYFLNVFASCIMAGIVLTIAGAFQGLAFTMDSLQNLGSLILIILILSVFMGIWQISLVMKFGSSKAKIIVMSVTVVIGIISSMVIGFMPELVENGMKHMIIAIACIVTAIFLGITCWLYHMGFVWADRKEF